MNDQEKLEDFVKDPATFTGSFNLAGLVAIARAIVIAACILKGRDIPWEKKK